MANKMAKMVKTMNKSSKKGKPSIQTQKRRTAAPVAQAPAADDMGLGGIINMGAKTIIGVGLLGGLGSAMGNMKVGGGNPPLPPP